MSKNKILFKITASIAAYKSCYIISKLVQSGYEVQTIVSKDALEFIGKASLEGLTGKQVFIDTFEDGKMMSHINLVKWADLTIVAPATGNTINKMAAGLGDNLLLSLFLAHDWQKPYIIAPAMNTNMYQHPATQSAIQTLKNWGVEFINPASGMLACGDEGIGKLAEPDNIYQYIVNKLSPSEKSRNPLKILITAGGTKENIDGVRYISNMSTGKTASVIANTLIKLGHDITYLYASGAIIPTKNCTKISYESFNDLNKIIEQELASNKYDAFIHNAAVSDYSVENISIDGTTYSVPLQGKISSAAESMKINLKQNFKIVNRIKSYSKNKSVKLISFKLVNGIEENEKLNKVKILFEASNSDTVVLNDIADRDKDTQQNFRIFSKDSELSKVSTSEELAKRIEQLLQNKPEEKL